MKKNLKLLYVYSIFGELLIIGPIIVMYLTVKGLSFTDIMILQSISAGSAVLMDVPTGAFADKLGKKSSLILGSLCWFVAMLLYVFNTHFVFFALAEFFFGTGLSFRSGAASALMYETLKSDGRENQIAKFEGKAKSLTYFSQAFGCIIAGFAYKINIELPLIFSAVFMLIAIGIALFLKESKKPTLKINSDEDGNILESAKFIWKHPKLKAIILYVMTFYIFYRISFWFYQPYMDAVHIPVEYFGIIFFCFNIIAGISSSSTYKIMQFTKPKTLNIMSLFFIISFLILGVVTLPIGVLAIGLQQFARGIYGPVTSKYINKHAPSNKRATILSFQSFLCNLSYALIAPIFGLIKDNTDIFTSNLILSGTMLILTIITTLYIDKRLGLKPNTK